MLFHERLAFIIRDGAVTKAEISRITGKNYQTILNYCNGSTKPDLPLFDALRKLIPLVNMNWLMHGIGELYLASPSGPGGGKRSRVVQMNPAQLKILTEPVVVATATVTDQSVALVDVVTYLHAVKNQIAMLEAAIMQSEVQTELNEHERFSPSLRIAT